MIYKATISLDFDNSLFESFKPEDKQGERSSYEVHHKDDKIIFMIKAKDPTSLRATLNSITKLLIVNEKTESIKDGR